MPSNLRLAEKKVLQPESTFAYSKGSDLDLSFFLRDVLEGPFTAMPKSTDEVSPIAKVYLSEEIFRTDVRPDILARVVRWQRNRWQQGTHKALTKGEVSGTGKKPYKQKGTGLARQGSMRNPHFRGGGAAFGPTPRDHAHDLNKKERRFGLRSALCARLQEGRFHIISNLDVPKNDKVDENAEAKPLINGETFVKTKEIADFIDKLDINSCVLVDTEQRENLALACRNTKHIHYLPQIGLNVYAILKAKHIVVTVEALRELEDRLSETKHRLKRYMKKGWQPEDLERKLKLDSENQSAIDEETLYEKAPVGQRLKRRWDMFRVSEHRKSQDPAKLEEELQTVSSQ